LTGTFNPVGLTARSYIPKLPTITPPLLDLIGGAPNFVNFNLSLNRILIFVPSVLHIKQIVNLWLTRQSSRTKDMPLTLFAAVDESAFCPWRVATDAGYPMVISALSATSLGSFLLRFTAARERAPL
jgi:hypothetical protein